MKIKPMHIILALAAGGGIWYLVEQEKKKTEGGGTGKDDKNGGKVEGVVIEKGEHRMIEYEILSQTRTGTYSAAVYVPYGTSPGDRTYLPGPFNSKDAAVAAAKAKIDAALGPE